MANYVEVGDDTLAVFNEAIGNTALERVGVEFMIIHNPTLKNKDIAKVMKAHAHLTFKLGIQVVIEINEDIFYKLDDTQQFMLAEELITQVKYNDEKDTVSISKGDVQTHMLFLKKYTLANYEALILSISQAKEKLKEDKGEE